MGKRRTRNTPHAEGDHGPKTKARLIKQLHASPREPPVDARLERNRARAALDGKRRLVEDRQQHDDAEKNSEHKRLIIEARRA